MKKILSLILVFMMIFGVFAVMPMTVGAKDVTIDITEIGTIGNVMDALNEASAAPRLIVSESKCARISFPNGRTGTPATP